MRQPLMSIFTTVVGALLLASAALADDDERTVAVTGTASATVVPDLARINMAVVERNESVTAAQSAAAAVTNRIVEILDALGVDRQQINTTSAVIRPDYRWDRKTEQRELLGYIVERNITVELKELNKLGELIEQVTRAGVNELSPPELNSSTRRDVYRQALAAAVKDARANADVIAQATGGRLGAALSVAADQVMAAPRPMLRTQLAADAVAESFTPGELTVRANVNVVYALIKR